MNVDWPYLPYLLLLMPAALIALGLRDLALRRRSKALRRALAAAELRYARDQALLERARAALAHELDLSEIFRIVVQAAAEIFSYSQSSIYLLEGDTLVLQHHAGYSQLLERMPVSRGIMGRTARSGEPVLQPDVSTDPDYVQGLPGIVSELCVPLLERGVTVGVLNIESTQGQVLGEADLKLMLALGAEVSFAITRARLHAQVHESEERFHHLADSGFEGIALHENGIIVDANLACARMFGYERAELIGRNVLSFVAAESRALALAQIRSGSLQPTEMLALRRDGSTFLAESQGRTLVYGTRTVRAVTMHDISERKRAELALRTSDARYRRLVESVQDVVYSVARDGTLRSLNQAFETVTGWPAAEWLGKPVAAMLHPDDLPRAKELFRRLIGGEARPIFELRVRKKDGQYVTGEFSAAREEENGVVTGLQGIARDISARKQAEQRLEEQAREMIALYGTLKDLTMRRDLPVLLRLIVERAALLLGDSSGGLYLCDPARREVRCVVSYNTARDYAGVTLKYGEGLAGIVAETGEPINIDDYGLWSGRAAVFEADYPFKSVLAVPMRWQGAVSGVLTVNSAVRRYTDAEVNLLSLFADQAAIAVENARLFDEVRRLAITDDLTGTANRRHLFLFGAREFQRARRFQHSLSALMLDLDHFKLVNDTFGHAVGDTVLRAVAEHCAAYSRDFDTVARYGGEEFAILLPETGREGARQLAERLRQSIAVTSFVQDQRPGLTVSIGVACIEPDMRDLAQLLDLADQALYAAKQAGRNRVAVWELSGIATASDAVPWVPAARAPT